MVRFMGVAPRLPEIDLVQTIQFYTELLGFRIGCLWPEEEPCFVLLDRDDLNIQFNQVQKYEAVVLGQVTLSFDVDEADALHQELLNWISIEWGPEVYWYGRREFAIRDPNGYLIIFSEPTEEAPTCLDEK